MSEILQSRYDRLVRRVADLKGPGSKVNDVIEELLPVLEVENVPAELLILQGTFLAMGRGGRNGAAPFFSQVMLRNPGESGQIMTIVEIRVFSGTAQLISLGPTLNTLANLSVGARGDTREFPNGPTGEVRTEDLLVPGPSFYTAHVFDTEAVIHPPLAMAVLGPGTAFSVSTSLANTDIQVSFLWKERGAEGSELNL